MADLFKPQYFIGAGKVKMRLTGSSDPLLDVGNVVEFGTNPTNRKVKIPNFRGGGGSAFSKGILDELGLKVIFANISSANIARVMGGVASSLVADTPSAESHVAALGGFIPLGLLDSAVSLLVQDATDTTSYVAGSDYDLSGTGITPLPGGNIANGDTLHISYGRVNREVIDLFVNAGLDWEIYMDGINDADGQHYVGHFYQWNPPPAAFAFLGADAALLESEGEVLPDDSKGSGASKFGRIEIAAPV